MTELLTRDQFREAVFARDGHTCVVCGQHGVDAHHIIERRLFPDGGYYLDNGVTLCAGCHLAAETTELSCETIREKASITEIVLPPHFFPDGVYDKWGNAVLPNGQRLQGELFYEDNVQKILAPILHLFTDKVKYPRTFHVPWSPNLQNDDRMMETTERWNGMEVVITEKMDGENTTLGHDYLHARSLEYTPAVWRERIRAMHGEIAYEVPTGFRICGENMVAKHSIKYTDLSSFLLVFGVWDKTTCLSWAETMDWCALLGLHTVPLIYLGPYDESRIKELCKNINPITQEGLVIRPAGRFSLKDFPYVVGKYVRKNHVQTSEHWTRQAIEYNQLGEK